LFFRLDSSTGRWTPGLAVSDLAFDKLVDNFLTSRDRDDSRPGSGAATYLGFLIDRTLEQEVRRRGRAAGLRGAELSECIESLKADGCGVIIRPEYDLDDSGGGNSRRVNVICSVPAPGGFMDRSLNMRAEMVTFELSRNHLLEPEVVIKGMRDLGPAATI
jgi:hypothetical protein